MVLPGVTPEELDGGCSELVSDAVAAGAMKTPVLAVTELGVVDGCPNTVGGVVLVVVVTGKLGGCSEVVTDVVVVAGKTLVVAVVDGGANTAAAGAGLDATVAALLVLDEMTDWPNNAAEVFGVD